MKRWRRNRGRQRENNWKTKGYNACENSNKAIGVLNQLGYRKDELKAMLIYSHESAIGKLLKAIVHHSEQIVKTSH